MIEVLVVDTQDMDNRVISFTSSGHGSTRVCAGASSLILAVSGFLKGFSDSIGDNLKVEVRQGDGKFVMDATLNSEDSGLHLILDTASQILGYGITAMSIAYSEDIYSEVITDMEETVSHQDKVDCIAEWRKSRDIIPEQMEPGHFIDLNDEKY